MSARDSDVEIAAGCGADVPYFVSADMLARAIVTAAQATGEDAPGVAEGEWGSRARWHALAGLLRAFPDADYRALGRAVGIVSAHSVGNCRALARDYAARKKWWDARVVEDVVEAMMSAAAGQPQKPRAPAPEPKTAAPANARKQVVAQVVAQAVAPARGGPVHPLALAERKPWVRTATTASVLGDPAPGRSALAQKQREGGL